MFQTWGLFPQSRLFSGAEHANPHFPADPMMTKTKVRSALPKWDVNNLQYKYGKEPLYVCVKPCNNLSGVDIKV